MIRLPNTPAYRKQSVFQIAFGENQEPFLGGPETYVGRIGTRLGVKVDLPPMKYEQAMPWIARGMASLTDTVEFRFRQPGIDTSDLVDRLTGSAAPANTYRLPWVYGGVGRNVVGEGQFVSIIQGVNKYLHVLTGGWDNTGSNIYPALRTALVGNEIVRMHNIDIQGSFNRSAITEWDLDRAMTVGLSFQIKETK